MSTQIIGVLVLLGGLYYASKPAKKPQTQHRH